MIYKKFKVILILVVSITSLMFAQNKLSFEQKISNQNYFEKRVLNLAVFDNNKLLYNFQRTLKPYRSVPKVLILSNNKLLLIFGQDGLFEFYNQNLLINKYILYKTHPLNEQSIITSQNENEIAIICSELQKNNIYFFNFDGNLIDSIKIENGLISGFTISDDNKFIAYSFFNWEGKELKNQTVILDKTTNDKTTIDLKFRNGIFNSEDNFFLGFTAKNAFCFDLQNSNLIWKDELKDKEMFLDGNFMNNNAVLVKANNPNLENGKWIYPNANIISKNILGNESLLEIIKTPFKNINFKTVNKKIQLKIDNQTVELTK